jgi:transcriptional regulator with XRE-family HTH domain
MATQHKQFSLEKTLTESIDLTNCGDGFMEVFENIKILRLFKGWTQEEMAEKLQMTPNGYAKIEHGKVDIPLSRLQQISEIFGVKLAQLVGLNEQNIFNFIENFRIQSQMIFHNDSFSQQSSDNTINQTTCKHELEKAYLIIEQKDKEIAYLKEIIELMKQK